jgi:hypothetical protein
MVHAGLAGGVAGHAVPVGLGAVSDGAGGADGVAGAVVHVEAVGTVEADEVLSALQTASGTGLTNRPKRGESTIACSLAD